LREANAGTAVASTTIWRGLGVLDDKREIKFPDENVGIIGGTDRSYVSQLAGAISFESVEATFEQLPHILEAGVKLVGTGVADGAGSGKIYAYPFPTTALNTIKTYTIEGGDNQQAEEMEYAFVDSFKLSGNPGEALMMDAQWIGRQVTNTTFTGQYNLHRCDLHPDCGRDLVHQIETLHRRGGRHVGHDPGLRYPARLRALGQDRHYPQVNRQWAAILRRAPVHHARDLAQADLRAQHQCSHRKDRLAQPDPSAAQAGHRGLCPGHARHDLYLQDAQDRPGR